MTPYVYNNYTICGDITYLDIQFKDQIIRAIIDTKMKSKVEQYHWRISVKKQKMYAVTGQYKNGTQLYLHDLCNLCPVSIKGYETDHYNGNSLDNRHENLRVISRQENIDNTRAKSNSKTQIRGVSYNSYHNTYNTDFSFHGRRFYVKPWNTLEEAVYCRYCFEKYYGSRVLESNPIAAPYLSNISNESKNYINTYVLSKISGN